MFFFFFLMDIITPTIRTLVAVSLERSKIIQICWQPIFRGWKETLECTEKLCYRFLILGLPPSDLHYQICKEHIISSCAYAAKNNISNTNSAFKDLNHLVIIHLPQNSFPENNPTVIKEESDFSNEFMVYHDYCENCGASFPYDRTIL